MTNTVENCSEDVLKDLKTEKKIKTIDDLRIEEAKCYILQVFGDPNFRLKAKSVRKKGVKAEFTADGWVFQDKKEAESVATRWSEGKRIIKVARWGNSLVGVIWHGSKEEAEIAKKKIRQEIETYEANERKNEVEYQCIKAGLHQSWLSSEILPDDMTETDKKTHARLKPLWDNTFQEQEKLNLQASDIRREEEDLKELASIKIGQEINVGGIPKKLTDMKSLDQRFAQLEAPGNPCVLINRLDAQPISIHDFNRRLSGEVVHVGFDNSRQPKYMSASKFWEGNSRKRIYNKIVFTNGKVDPDHYNLFTGFGIEPKKGICELILNHIKEVICSRDETNYNAFIKLLAWQIQNIGKPSRVIVMLKSEQQQVGKGTLLQDILIKIYGNAGYQTSEMDQIIGRFNDTLRGKSLIHLDEALYSGNRKASDALKSLSTSTTIGVETKNIPTVKLPIGINFFLSTNHRDAAYIEEEDMRYWILEVSPHRQNNTSYFNLLYEEIEGEGTAAFMFHLLNLDVSGFIPARDVPKDNVAKENMIKNSVNPFDARKWLEECIENGMILGLKQDNSNKLPYEKSTLPYEPWIMGIEYENGLFWISYQEWQKSVKSPVAAKPTPSNTFGKLLNDVGFEQRNQSGRLRTIPDPEKCKEELKKQYLNKKKK